MANSVAATSERICIVGLGYVGLPLAAAFGRLGLDVIGFDIQERRIEELSEGHDRTGGVTSEELAEAKLRFSSDPSCFDDRTFFIVTVPTPIDQSRQPDLTAMKSASRGIAPHLKPGAVVVYESTVYPGVTEDICRPILAEKSGLVPGVDFKVGYSPERINPGDREHRLETIVKVVAGEDAETLDRVDALYSLVVRAGTHRAGSIKIAEAAKVIENTQRDLNIALMNELAIIFGRMGIPTMDVLRAAGTKWNFLRFTPGLVGGHCIGVDPYYLTAKAEEMGYHPEVILAGRRINDNMGKYISQMVVKKLFAGRRNLNEVRITILGFTFKENVPDIRNSRVVDIYSELKEYGLEPYVYDPMADPEEITHEYGITMTNVDAIPPSDVVILAVPHKPLLDQWAQLSKTLLKPGGIVYDVRSALRPDQIPAGVDYAAL